MQKNDILEHPFTLTASFFAIITLYSLLYAPYGLDLGDMGFITGYGWRILNGEIPYNDFIYIRPPVSLAIHAIVLAMLPDQIEQLASRTIFYLCVALYCLASVKLLEKHFRIPFPSLAFLAAFIFSAHNFPPMPWHTVDGILLSALGLYLLSRKRFFAAGIVLVLAALTKQSFYPTPILGLIYSVYYGAQINTVRYVGGAAMCLAFFLGALLHFDALDNFLRQTASQTKLDDLITAGIEAYVKEAAEPLAIALALYFCLKNIFRLSHARETTLWLALIIITIKWISLGLKKNAFFLPPSGIMQMLLVFSAAYGLTQLTKTLKKEIPSPWVAMLLLVAIAWCSSISWGYATPALYSAPLIISTLLFYGTNSTSHLFAIAIIISGLAIFYVAQQHPYGDQPRTELTQHAGEVFSKLYGIKISTDKYQKLEELKFLHEKYGCFKTLPSVPQANYLTNTLSPLPIDWALNIESSNLLDHLQKVMDNSGCVALIEKDKIEYLQREKDAPFGSTITLAIIGSWEEIEKTNHFSVYKSAYK